jgi:dTDP-4-dehydrorhamnose 3,5-epimerase
MDIAPLDVAGAWVCTPARYADDRGEFMEWFRADLVAEVTGRAFGTAQANLSVSRRGVVRGLHVADVPPGQAKIVACPRGAVLDVVVDVRVGSPTFGRCATAVLDDVDRRVMVVAVGLAHGFCALREDSVVSYLVSAPYTPAAERTIDALDPALALPWPDDLGELSRSPRDAIAPTLAQGQEQGILPSYEDCLAWYAG